MSTRIPGFKIKDGKVVKTKRNSKRITVKGKRSQHPL